VAFTRAAELDPADADALAGRARAHAQLRQLPAAALDFDAALARSPATPAWHGERGLVRLLQADEAGAAADFVQCAKLDPRCSETFGARIAAVEAGLGRPPRDWFAPP
jgi:Flp pilus assembly protein TadD